ncbi:hypothetical protein [Clostridium botulinum]|uniref:hypothetical protein n=1 Tax=Clostridium botulinum TaxID=1491 RepID=UPI0004D68FD2|nr:hypothetical protein [Clostridium botulinum]KEI05910.1 hypothetical protein Z952_04925 [Clostridium botulinum C/D str. BKT75002]KEI09364.1 hypothetical protein Z954_13180 [Clostridium botulinum C/D str. BKT2873]QPW62200.1 hypothetical protein IG390_14925 [Clostridium botulinum]
MIKNLIHFWKIILGLIFILTGIIPVYLILFIYPFKGFNSFMQSLKWSFTESCDKDFHIIGVIFFIIGLMLIIDFLVKSKKFKK